jgi:hypothetical protein
MKVTLPLGILFFAFGLMMAAVAMLGPGEASEGVGHSPVWYIAVPVISGLALAFGSLLVGLSFGNWQHPRAHVEPGDEIVDPEGHHKVKHV